MRVSPMSGSWSRLLTVGLVAGLALAGCGVSGKTEVNAAATTTTTVVGSAPSAPPTSSPTTRSPGDTTIPGGTGTTTPDSSNPFENGDFRSMLIQSYKQSGFTDKEARCVADIVVKDSDGETFDPEKFDITKLMTAARRCFGADGRPGGSD